MFWKKHRKTQGAFHPHSTGLAPIRQNYPLANSATAHLDFDLDELAGVEKFRPGYSESPAQKRSKMGHTAVLSQTAAVLAKPSEST
jgi:hypothetical protein